ncbi:MAG: hypothetical protein K6F35_10830 [Lachnospiraceae bacterium]|nr:hypothetical protein [Lachnospiraceae bacterium]
MIARDAPLFDILFVRPHYEGHPPLWHLILLLPARAGLPYEPSIKTIQLIFALAMVWLILFRSPFPRPVRLFLPFTYFFFYQYGVIARPYAMFCVAIFLTAIFWKERNEKPWRLCLAMLWMCLSTAYGIALAGGMALAWVLPLLRQEKISFFRNGRRFLSLCFLFVCAMVLIFFILPKSDAHAVVIKDFLKSRSFLFQLLFFWIVIPSDVLCTSLSDYACIFEQQNIHSYDFISAAIVSFPVYVFLFFLCKRRKKTLLLLLPLCAMSLVSAGGYLNAHHYGILLAFLLGIVWICLDDIPFQTELFHKYLDKLHLSPPSRHIISHIPHFCLIIFAVINLYWSMGAAYAELTKPYGYGRECAKYINEHHLNDYRWLEGWNIIRDKENPQDILYEDTNFANSFSICINPYLSHNLLNNLPPEISYATHKVSSPLQIKQNLEKWRQEPDPDIIASSMTDYSYIISSLAIQSDYKQIKIASYRMIWKADPGFSYPLYIYIQTDLAGKLNL